MHLQKAAKGCGLWRNQIYIHAISINFSFFARLQSPAISLLFYLKLHFLTLPLILKNFCAENNFFARDSFLSEHKLILSEEEGNGTQKGFITIHGSHYNFGANIFWGF